MLQLTLFSNCDHIITSGINKVSWFMTWSQAQRSPAHLPIFCEHPMKRKLAQNEGVKNFCFRQWLNWEVAKDPVLDKSVLLWTVNQIWNGKWEMSPSLPQTKDYNIVQHIHKCLTEKTQSIMSSCGSYATPNSGSSRWTPSTLNYDELWGENCRFILFGNNHMGTPSCWVIVFAFAVECRGSHY